MIYEDEHTLYYIVSTVHTKVRYPEIYKYLEYTHDMFFPISLKILEDGCVVTIEKSEVIYTWKDMLDKKTVFEKIQICLETNIFKYVSTTPFVTCIRPENICIGIDYKPKLLYRGIIHQIIPYINQPEQILKQRKALVISSLFPNYTYDFLLHGLFLLEKLPVEAQEMFEATTHELLNIALELYYVKVSEKQKVKSSNLLSYGMGYILFISLGIWFLFFNMIVLGKV